MSDPFVGEIRMFGGTFAPRGWAFCEGQLLAVSQNDALFSLFGTIYGGDGRTTFGLPDLRGRVAIHNGTGPGLTQRRIGSQAGAERVTLTTNQLPQHTHAWQASTAAAQSGNPIGAYLAKSSGNIYSDAAPDGQLRDAISDTGGSQGHDNLQPYLCVNFIVALFGVYPSRQ